MMKFGISIMYLNKIVLFTKMSNFQLDIFLLVQY